MAEPTYVFSAVLALSDAGDSTGASFTSSIDTDTDTLTAAHSSSAELASHATTLTLHAACTSKLAAPRLAAYTNDPLLNTVTGHVDTGDAASVYTSASSSGSATTTDPTRAPSGLRVDGPHRHRRTRHTKKDTQAQ